MKIHVVAEHTLKYLRFFFDALKAKFQIKDNKYYPMGTNQGIHDIDYMDYLVESIEIIGNIYENPELLESQNDL